MTLVQGGRKIAIGRRDRNLFFLNLTTPNKGLQVTQPSQVIMTQDQGRLA